MNSLIKTKLSFLRKNNSKFFRLPLPSETCIFPFEFVLKRDLKNIFYYQHDVENYMDLVDFLWFGKHEYTTGIFQSVILVSIFMLRVCETFSLFLKIWLTQSILIFRKSFFRGTCYLLASNTVCNKFFLMKISSLHWNGAAYICKEKLWEKLPMSIKCHDLHSFETRQIPHLYGSALCTIPLSHINWKHMETPLHTIVLMSSFHQLRVMQKILYRQYQCRRIWCILSFNLNA